MFKYIGLLVTNTNEVETEIKVRIIVGNKCYHALGHILKKSYITHSLRVRLYKTIRRPIVTYGAESRTQTNKMAGALIAWEREVLRKYMGQHMKMVPGE